MVAYECDALPHLKARPGLVVLPQSRDEVVAVVRLAYEAGLPIVPRGSGTGLSGGAMPIAGCLLLGLSRMRRILDIDLDNQRMRVEPGVVNLDISKRLAPHGFTVASPRDPEARGGHVGVAHPEAWRLCFIRRDATA